MANTYWSLKNLGNFLQNWSNAGLITANDNWSNVPSIVGFLGQDITTATGTDPRTLTADSAVANDVDVIANQTNPNTLNSGGVAEFDSLADPTIALQGSGTADAPYIAVYLDTTDRENIVFSFRARDIDGSADNAIQQLNVQYRIGGSGAWTNVPGGYLADASSGPSLATLETLVSVTLPSAANNQGQVEVRVMTTNAVGNDEWIGIDDIGVTSDAITTPQPGNFSINDVTVLEGAAATTTDMVFTVTRAGGSSGTATIGYTVNLPGTGGQAGTNDFVSPVTSGTLTFLDGETSKTITLTVQGDAQAEANETFTVTLGTPSVGALSDGSGLGTITNDDGNVVGIYDIQGLGHRSGFVGQSVVTSGVVTAVDTNGFYLQDATGDGDIRTSDGIFVFTSTAPTVVVGNAITITATVGEFTGSTAGSLSLTQLTSPTAIVVNTPSVALPVAVVIATDGSGRAPPTSVIEDDGFTSYDPTTDGIDFWESLEGMRVTMQAPLVVANTNGFGETYVVASGGAGATGINDRGGITISAGDFNPEKIQIDDDSGVFAGYTPNHSQGDSLADVTGIVNYAFAEYEIVVTDAVTTTNDVTLTRETTDLVGDDGQFSYASFNMENFDPLDGAAKIALLATEIVQGLRSPDIIGAQEIQDADGPGSGTNYSGQVTAQLLIDAVATLGGPTYRYVEIAPTSNNSTGGEPNGNIRNGFFYNTERMTYVEGSAALINDAAYAGSRRPLVADFMFNGERITSINVHSTSRGGSDPLWGANQPPADAGDNARTAQATAVRTYINSVLAVDPAHKFVVNGDFNGFYFETALQNLTAGGVIANLYDTLPVEERYSYIFGGNYQTLDHILVSGGLLAGSQLDVVHYNAFVDAANQATDHDQPIATIGLARSTAAAVAVADAFTTTEAALYRGTVLANDTGGGAGLVVATVNGIAPGTTQTLASGAQLTLLLNGTYTYDPDGAFSALATGATATDSFSYTLPNGSTATATITIAGITAAAPTDGNDTIGGTPGADNFDLSAGGNDTVSGGAGDDNFAFGAAFSGLDRVNGGSGTNDQVGLLGDYTGGNRLVLNANTLTNVEVLAALPGFSYDITSHDGNVAAGQTLAVFAGNLAAGQNFTFDGSAETDGNFRTYGGLGIDTITGGAQDDAFYFGPGKWGAGDTVTGGGGTNDQLGLDGDYTITLGASADVEVVVLLGGPAGTPNTFNITLADALTPADELRTVFATAVTTALTIDGSAETDGELKIYGGQAGDTITGGAGNDIIFGNGGGDTLRGGAGIDTFLYDAVSQSTSVTYDRLLDFDYDVDQISIDGAPVDTFSDLNSGTLSTASFDADLTAALNGPLAAGSAVRFTPNAGTLAGTTFLVVDANGTAGYQAGQDYVFQTSSPPVPVSELVSLTDAFLGANAGGADKWHMLFDAAAPTSSLPMLEAIL